MDVYDSIKEGHVNASRIIKQINKLPNDKRITRIALFRQLKEELIMHNNAQEITLYVALKYHASTEKDALISKKQHREITKMLEELDDINAEAKSWYRKFAMFQISLFKHVKREEEKIFDRARKVVPSSLANILAVEMDNLKKLYKKEAARHAAAM